MTDKRMQRMEERLRAEIEFKMKLQQGFLPPQPTFQEPELPAGVDPNQTVTMAEFRKALGYLQSHFGYHLPLMSEAQTRKITLGIGPAQEIEVLNACPEIGGLSEPARTLAICEKWSQLQRFKQWDAEDAEEEAKMVEAAKVATPTLPLASPVPQQPASMGLPAQHTVPDLETGGGQMSGLPSGELIDPEVEELKKEMAQLDQVRVNQGNYNEIKEKRRFLVEKLNRKLGLDSVIMGAPGS